MQPAIVASLLVEQSNISSIMQSSLETLLYYPPKDANSYGHSNVI